MSIDLLHVIGTLERGGAEQQLIYLATELQKLDWSQAVVTFDPGQAWDHRVRALGIPLLELPRGPSVPRRLWQFSRLVARAKPRLIHSWSLFTNVYTRWVPVFRPVRRIGSFRQDPTIQLHDGEKRPAIPGAGIYRVLDCTISNTRMAFEQIAAQNIRVRRAEVVRNIVRLGPGTDKHPILPDPDTEQGWHLLAVGRLIPLKAYDILLQALTILAGRGYSFRLSLAGDGPEREPLAKLATGLGIGDRVHLLGEVDDVPQCLQSAHIMVHPSRSEGMSNTILEGMAAGLPVVAAHTGGTPEIVQDRQTGLLVPPDDPLALAEALACLLDTPGLREQLGNAAHHWVATHCAPAVIAGQYADIYASLL